jgi:predicted ATP-grasp superfamily ATP-dependent carboligase
MKFSEKHSFIRPVIVGQFGPPTLTCIRSWGEQRFPVGMVCIRSRRELMPASKYLGDFTTLTPEKLYADNGIQIINDFLKNFRANGIICIAEKVACWLNDHRQMLPEEVALWLPSNNTINALISKQKQIEVARKIGFKVLPTYLIDRNFKTIEHILENHFPLCLRPDDPAAVAPVFKVHLVYSHGELKQYVKSLKTIDGPLIAQPFMNCPNLVVHGARTVVGNTIGLQAFLVDRKFEGVTLTLRPTNIDRDFLDKCVDFTNYFNVTGNYHFEFLLDRKNGFIYFLELNNRLGGTTAKVFACGYDEPLLALQAYGAVPILRQPSSIVQRLKTNIEQPAASNQRPATILYRPLANITVSSKRALLKYLLFTIKNKITPLDYPSESKLNRILKTIYGLLKYRDDIFMFRDLRGSFALYFESLKNRL